MRLPNAENAVIAPEKLRDYLLSATHERGRNKAAFFSRLGYTDVNWREFEKDLRGQILELEAEELTPTRYGRKFIIRGGLQGPAGEAGSIVSVWAIREGEERPRLVTAYPDKTR